MTNIKYVEELDKENYNIINNEFNKYANENNVIYNYKTFNFVARENNKIIGIITGHSYYKEIHIEDLIVLKDYRNKHIGSKLMKTVEDYFKDKDFENINLTTYEFQAPEFYKKCGYKLEFMRKNKENSKYNKYYFIKYLY